MPTSPAAQATSLPPEQPLPEGEVVLGRASPGRRSPPLLFGQPVRPHYRAGYTLNGLPSPKSPRAGGSSALPTLPTSGAGALPRPRSPLSTAARITSGAGTTPGASRLGGTKAAETWGLAALPLASPTAPPQQLAAARLPGAGRQPLPRTAMSPLPTPGGGVTGAAAGVATAPGAAAATLFVKIMALNAASGELKGGAGVMKSPAAPAPLSRAAQRG